MKKLLIFMLVLGLASAANATLQISVGGNPEPEDTTIFLAPSETIELDIWTDSAITLTDPLTWHNIWAMVVQTADGSISGGIVMEPWASGDPTGYVLMQNATAFGQIPEPGADGVWGATVASAVVANPGDVLFDLIVFHCDSLNYDTIITIYDSADGVNWNYQDSVVIHQIPEPMTIALLGLGGLFLRRRK